MSVFKKGNAWYVDYYVDGRRKREAAGPNKREAEAILAKRKTQVREGKFFDVRREGRTTFDELAKMYIELHSRVNKRPRTHQRDLVSLVHLQNDFGGMRLADISPQLIERYKAKRSQEYPRGRGTTTKPGTINRELALLKNMFTKAIEWG